MILSLFSFFNDVKYEKIMLRDGNLTYYDDSDADDDSDDFNDYEKEQPPSFDLMCMECHDKKSSKSEKNRKNKLLIKNFAKDHWKFWIGTSITIIFGIIGLSLL